MVVELWSAGARIELLGWEGMMVMMMPAARSNDSSFSGGGGGGGTRHDCPGLSEEEGEMPRREHLTPFA